MAEAVAGLVDVPAGLRTATPVTLDGTAADLVVGLADGGTASGPVAVLATPRCSPSRSPLPGLAGASPSQSEGAPVHPFR